VQAQKYSYFGSGLFPLEEALHRGGQHSPSRNSFLKKAFKGTVS